jgi:hypothetical protein
MFEATQHGSKSISFSGNYCWGHISGIPTLSGKQTSAHVPTDVGPRICSDDSAQISSFGVYPILTIRPLVFLAYAQHVNTLVMTFELV